MTFLIEANYKSSALYKARLASFLIYKSNIQGSFRKVSLKGIIYKRLDQHQVKLGRVFTTGFKDFVRKSPKTF